MEKPVLSQPSKQCRKREILSSPTRSSFHRGFDCFHLTALICFGINVHRVKTADYCSLFYCAWMFYKIPESYYSISFSCCGFVTISRRIFASYVWSEVEFEHVTTSFMTPFTFLTLTFSYVHTSSLHS